MVAVVVERHCRAVTARGVQLWLMGRNVFRLSPDGYRLIGGRDYPEISCIRVRSRAGQLPTPRLAGRSQSSRRPRKCQLCFRRGSAFGIHLYIYPRPQSIWTIRSHGTAVSHDRSTVPNSFIRIKSFSRIQRWGTRKQNYERRRDVASLVYAGTLNVYRVCCLLWQHGYRVFVRRSFSQGWHQIKVT